MRSSNAPAPPIDGQLHDALDLEFSDWSGMAPRRTRMSLEQAVQWNEEMLELCPPHANRAALNANARCHAEFRLL